MQYQSTRDKNLKASSAQAILNGLAPDGGLYTMPSFDEVKFDYTTVLNMDTMSMSTKILSKLLPDFSEAEMAKLVHDGYTGKFETDHLTPTVPVGEDFILELFRGPTSAFKDVALSMLPRLMTASKEKLGVDDEIMILPATSGIARFFKTIGNTGICMLLVTVMCLLKVDGKPLLRFKTMVDSGVTWGIILILAVVMPLSHAMANDESGITKFLMALMTPFFGNESSLVFALCMGFFATVLTQFMNNGATGIALMPVVYSYCTGMNVPPELAIIMVVMGVHIAFLTPAASASASLLHGNEWSNTKAIWRTVPIVILATWATISAIVVALGVALF